MHPCANPKEMPSSAHHACAACLPSSSSSAGRRLVCALRCVAGDVDRGRACRTPLWLNAHIPRGFVEPVPSPLGGPTPRATMLPLKALAGSSDARMRLALQRALCLQPLASGPRPPADNPSPIAGHRAAATAGAHPPSRSLVMASSGVANPFRAAAPASGVCHPAPASTQRLNSAGHLAGALASPWIRLFVHADLNMSAVDERPAVVSRLRCSAGSHVICASHPAASLPTEFLPSPQLHRAGLDDGQRMAMVDLPRQSALTAPQLPRKDLARVRIVPWPPLAQTVSRQLGDQR